MGRVEGEGGCLCIGGGGLGFVFYVSICVVFRLYDGGNCNMFVVLFDIVTINSVVIIIISSSVIGVNFL